MLGVPACRPDLGVQVAAEGHRGLQRRRAGEHQLGVLRGQPDAGGGLPGLDEHRVTLRGAGEGQDSVGVVVLTVEMRGVQLAAIGPHAALTVTDDRAVPPAVPRALHHIDELVGPRVPVGMVGVEGLTEVGRGQRRNRGDDVPAGPARAEMIQRREPAGQLPRLAVGGRAGPDQPDAAGDGGQRGQHRDRVELRLRQVGGPVFGDGDVVGQEDRIHQAAFGDPGDVGVVGQPENAAYVVRDHAPGRLVVAVRPDERAEVQWLCAHGSTPS